MSDTPQARLKAGFEKLPIPYIEIQVYGNQITVECKSFATAKKWEHVLDQMRSGGVHLRGIIESVRYKKKNENSVMNPSRYRVWRVYAAIK